MPDSTSFSLRTDIAAAVVKIDEIKAVVDAIAEIDFAALSANIVYVHEFQTYRIFPSDDILLSADTERSVTGPTPEKVKEFRVSLTGIYRISLEIRSSKSPYSAAATFFRNGVAWGSLSTTGTSYVVKTLDFYLEIDDVLEVFLRGTDTWIGYIKNCRLCGSYSEVVSQVILD